MIKGRTRSPVRKRFYYFIKYLKRKCRLSRERSGKENLIEFFGRKLLQRE